MDPFQTALDTAVTAIQGYADSAVPAVAAIAVAFLAVKYVRRVLKGL